MGKCNECLTKETLHHIAWVINELNDCNSQPEQLSEWLDSFFGYPWSDDCKETLKYLLGEISNSIREKI